MKEKIINIYIKLLNEGTEVYRPVPAMMYKDDTYRVLGDDIHDPTDEEWEFLPGTLVLVNTKNISGENLIVAVKKISDNNYTKDSI